MPCEEREPVLVPRLRDDEAVREIGLADDAVEQALAGHAHALLVCPTRCCVRCAHARRNAEPNTGHDTRRCDDRCTCARLE